jgi:hypothetical protein
MRRIILQPIGTKIEKDSFVEAKNTSWGEKEQYKKIFKDSIGDTVLFIKNRIIIAMAIITDIKVNDNTNENYPLRYFWKNIKYINIPMEEINKIVGYKLNFNPQGYMVIKKDENIDEVYNFLDNVKLINSIEDSKKLSATEKEALIKIRIGQSKFRQNLIDYWKGCSVTQYKDEKLLIASHIKPWKDSKNNEKLDTYNGLLLTPNLDKLFDRGYISFDDEGCILFSEYLNDKEGLFLNEDMKIKIENEHKKYLKFHRDNIFK